MTKHRCAGFHQGMVLALIASVSLGVLADCSPQGTAWGGPARGSAKAPANAPALDAGATAPGKNPEAKAASPAPPKLPRDSRRACHKDADCVLVPQRPCMCPECGTAWREVLNRSEVDKMQAIWAKRRCVQRPCPRCESRLLGTKAVCRTGQCVVE
jgi:hypothetical protein